MQSTLAFVHILTSFFLQAQLDQCETNQSLLIFSIMRHLDTNEDYIEGSFQAVGKESYSYKYTRTVSAGVLLYNLNFPIQEDNISELHMVRKRGKGK